MTIYGIFDENGKVIGEVGSITEGIDRLRELMDGEVRAYEGDGEGYYTDRYSLERGYVSRVCRGRTEIKFKDGYRPCPYSSTELGIILSQLVPDEFEEMLVTIDTDKARDLYENLTTPSLTWNEKEKIIGVNFYYFETEDTPDADCVLYYKCDSFTP